jgi:predicted dehydrogenase
MDGSKSSAIGHLPSAIGVAVIGVGYWGPNLIRTFADLPGCGLVSICDLNPARLQTLPQKYPGVRTTTRLEEVLADPAIEAVAIATPAESHRQIAEACLQAGRHVFVEKPLAACSRDAEALVRVAEEGGHILMVGHIFLFDTAISQLVHSVQAGEIGQIRYVYGVRTSMAGTARLDTNIIWDALVHDAYILPELFGHAPRRVKAVGAGYLMPGVEDVAFVTFDFGDNPEDGALAQVYVSWYALEKARRITVVGSRAILSYDDLSEARLVRYHRRYDQSQERDPQGRLRWHWRDEGGQPIDIARSEPLRAECQHFIECIVAGKQPATDGWSGLAAVRVLEACERSLDNNNTWIELNSYG